MKSTDKEKPILSGQALLSLLVQQQKRLMLTGVLIGALATLVLIFQWYWVARLVDEVVRQQEPLSYAGVILILLALVLRAALTRWQDLWCARASLDVRSRLRRQLLFFWHKRSAVENLSFSPASLASQWLEDIESMDGYFSRYWPQQYLTVVSPVMILAVVFYTNWVAGLLLLISAPLIPLFMVLVGKGAQLLNQSYLSQRQRLAGHFLDRVKHLATIRLFGATKEVGEDILDKSDRYRIIVMKTLRIAFLSSAVLEFFTSVAVASIAVYIGFALYGAITWGPAAEITLFSGLFVLLLAPDFFQPLRNFSQFYHDRAAALASADLIVRDNAMTPNDVLVEAPVSEAPVVAEPDPPAASGRLSYEQPCLVLSAVVASHHDAVSEYQPVSLTLHHNHTLVMTGPSGIGKTTLLLTLAGFLPAREGQIYRSPVMNEGVRFFPQNPWVINGTWAENLRLLSPDASEESMIEALSFLGLDDLLGEDRHLSLQRRVNEHGEGLSGGQLRRLALARLLLSKGSVLFLDEPTASLDSVSRAFVLKALARLKTHSTLVIVSHDEEVLKLADVHLPLSSIVGSQHEE